MAQYFVFVSGIGFWVVREFSSLHIAKKYINETKKEIQIYG